MHQEGVRKVSKSYQGTGAITKPDICATILVGVWLD